MGRYRAQFWGRWNDEPKENRYRSFLVFIDVKPLPGKTVKQDVEEALKAYFTFNYVYYDTSVIKSEEERIIDRIVKAKLAKEEERAKAEAMLVEDGASGGAGATAVAATGTEATGAGSGGRGLMTLGGGGSLAESTGAGGDATRGLRVFDGEGVGTELSAYVDAVGVTGAGGGRASERELGRLAAVGMLRKSAETVDREAVLID